MPLGEFTLTYNIVLLFTKMWVANSTKIQLPTPLFQDFFCSISFDATALPYSYSKIKARKAGLYHIPHQDLRTLLNRNLDPYQIMSFTCYW